MATVRIVLTEEAHQCLLDSFNDEHPAWRRLSEAVSITGSGAATNSRVVACEVGEAMTLLTVAERACPTAVQPIKIGIIEATK